MHRLNVRPSAGAGGGRDLLGARLELAHRAGGLRQHLDAAAAAARALGEVALDVRKLGVEPAGGLEQRLGQVQRSDLVERDARVVEQHGLARLGVERVERSGRSGDEHRGARAGGEAGLDDRAAGVVAAVDVVVLQRLGDERAVAGPVAGGQARGRVGREARGGSCAGGGLPGRLRGIDETEGHARVHRRPHRKPETPEKWGWGSRRASRSSSAPEDGPIRRPVRSLSR
jgi:hypothetical protein